MTQHPHRNLREIFDTTLTDEPPLVDIVTGAVEGAHVERRRRRRNRLAVAASPLALLMVGAGLYAVRPSSGPTSAGSETPPTATPHRSVVFPPVAENKPVNATPEVHKTALQMCGRDWSTYLAPRGANTMPTTQQQAVDMCVMVGETLMTLLPDATVTLADAPDLAMPNSPGEQWVVKTAAGRTQFGLHYLWPDGAYEKKHYGPFDECAPNPIDNPPATYVPGPNSTPVPMRDPNAGHNQFCAQSRPGPQFYGALTIDDTDNSLFYSVVNRDYGRYMISTAPVPIPVTTRPTEGEYSEINGKYFISGKNDPQAMTVAQFGNVLLDPRFNDFLIRYEDYVLSHATADSFVVSGSKPVH